MNFGWQRKRGKGCASDQRAVVTMRTGPSHKIRVPHHSRRGVALVDVIIGGVLLATGLAVIISLAARAMRIQTDGEKQLVASWIADEYLNMVLIEGPLNYPKLYDTAGRCDSPFDEFEYDVFIEDQGIGFPMRVTATVYWDGPMGVRNVQAQTLMADRGHEPNQPRAPWDFVDRINRWYDIREKQQRQ